MSSHRKDNDGPEQVVKKKPSKRELQQLRNQEKNKKQKLEDKRSALENTERIFSDALNRVTFSLQEHKKVIIEISHLIVLHGGLDKKPSFSNLNDLTQLDDLVGDQNKPLLSNEGKTFLAEFNTHFGLLKIYQRTKVPSLKMNDILKMDAKDGHPVMQQHEITAKDSISMFLSDVRKVINTMQTKTKSDEAANLFHIGKCHISR